MASATISNSGGPGSTIQLAPETIRVRDAVIERCENQTLEQMNEFVKSLLANETDELKRLGVLAARVFILRQRIHNLGAEGQIVDAKDLLDGTHVSNVATATPNAPRSETMQNGWTRLRIVKECQVNDVRFFNGAIVDVRAEDAEALIKSGNAEIQNESKPATPAPATAKEDHSETTAKSTPKSVPVAEAEATTKTLEASSTKKTDNTEHKPQTIEPEELAKPSPTGAALPPDLDTPFEDSSTSGLSDEERADEAMEAIFAAADKQEAEMAEAAAKAAADAEAAAKAAAEAEIAARGIIDDTNEPETETTTDQDTAAETAPEKAKEEKEATDNKPAELDATEIGVDSSDLEELAAFAGLTGEPSAPKVGGDDETK